MNPKTDGRVGGIKIATRMREHHADRQNSKTMGLCAGTIVLTMKGEMPVEALQFGDRIITRDTGMATLRALKTTPAVTKLVTIKAGTLGNTRPDKDMSVAPDTLILIRDWRAQALFGKAQAAVPASRLIDGEYVVTQASDAPATLYTLDFGADHVIYADGVEICCST